MMNIDQMAHDYAMLHMNNPQYKNVDDLEMVQWAFDYAEAMQAESDKRKPKGLPEVLFEPDWSVAPDWANWWAMDDSGYFWWYQKEPKNKDGGWCVTYTADDFLAAPSFNYQGDWKDSLRKRP